MWVVLLTACVVFFPFFFFSEAGPVHAATPVTVI